MATNIHLWASCATGRASLQDPSFRSLKWLEVAWTFCWNSDWGSGLEALADPHTDSASS